MSHIRNLLRAGAMVGLAIALSGCITVFPKTKPAQLYRFDGADEAQITPGDAANDRVGIVRVRGGFNGAASSDRIMTVTGSQIAYVAEARWAQPAVSLFDEALTRAFTRQTGPVRLVARGEPGRAPYSLRLDVERFEAVYDRGEKAAPDVRVEVHAVLVRAADRAVIKDQVIATHARAGDNRVSAIVQAFELSTKQALDEVVKLTAEGAQPVAG
jgi:cholesterol transport system auxiliary component